MQRLISCRDTGWSLTGAHNEHGWENLVEKERETPTNLMKSDKLSLWPAVTILVRMWVLKHSEIGS